MKILSSALAFVLIAGGIALPAEAQAESSATESDSAAAAQAPSAADDAAQANNPLAAFTAFNIHNYYVPKISESDGTSNTFWLRYAQPFGRWLMRASLPTMRVPTVADESTSGLGDLNVFLAYLLKTGNPARSFGIGPQLTAPTATEDETGAGKWQGGFATVFFDASSKRFQWGALLTWQTSFAGNDDRADTSVLALQPFYMLQLGKGFYARGVPIMVFNLETNDYAIPYGLGLGKVISTPKIVYNVFVEPQFTILDRGPGQPQLQIFFGFNLQFKK
jgi:hypothetical protein